jgi:PAS domain S-box-containing protein
MFVNRIWFTMIMSCLILFCDYSGVGAETRRSAEKTITRLKPNQEWSYHWGDFDLDAQGRPLGVENPSAWTPYPNDGLGNRGPHTFLWLKKTFAGAPIANPAIFIPSFSMNQSFEIYLDQTPIYKAGELRPVFANNYLSHTWHLFALPADYAGKTLFLRFYSDHPTNIGLIGNIYLGEHNALFEQVIFHNFHLTILSLLFIIAGLFSYVVFMKVYARGNYAVFAFATLATFSGVHLLADASYLFQYVGVQPRILTYVWNCAFFLFMAGIYGFCEFTIGIGRKWVYRLFWQFQVACLLLFVLCDLLSSLTINPYWISVGGASLGILVGSFDTVKLLRQGNREARILSLGFGVSAVSGLLSMWSDWQVTIYWEPYPYGLLFLLASLAYLLILRYQAERKSSEELVRRSEERLAGIVGALTDAITMIDAQGLIVWANAIAHDLFGGDLVNQNYQAVAIGDPNRKDLQAITACLQDGKPQEYELTFIFADGKRKDYWGMVNVAARQPDGQPGIVIQVLREITALKMLQTETARTARLASLGELAAGVAHEINNPINGIMGYAEILADESAEQGTSAEIPALILKESKRIAKIVRSLLAFAREQPRVFSLTRMQDILADALMLTAKLFQQSEIRIQLDIPSDLPLIMADGQQIQQVLLNLLHNARYALDHIPPEKKEAKILTITCQLFERNSRQYLRTIFHDNGIGIPATILDKICDPFYTTKPGGEGTGLGLSISYGIIKDHDGQLLFESQEGAYTKVFVELPVISEENDSPSEGQ